MDIEKVARKLFKFEFPDLEWGHSGTVDDESWRRIEQKHLRHAQELIDLIKPEIEAEIRKDEREAFVNFYQCRRNYNYCLDCAGTMKDLCEDIIFTDRCPAWQQEGE